MAAFPFAKFSIACVCGIPNTDVYKRQVCLLPFIRIPAALHAAQIRGKSQLLRGQVNDKFPCFLQHGIRISLRPDRNRNHGRIAAYGSRPRYGKNIAVPGLIGTAYHNRRKRVQHIAGLPLLLSH